jgi:hypothetical protein
MIEHYSLLAVFFWLLMLPIAVWVLVRVTGYFADDFPSTLTGALVTVLLTVVAVYLAYDFSAYRTIRLLQDPRIGIRLPPNFTYIDWMMEPTALKWQVLGIVPFARFVPVLIGGLVGGVVQMLLWKVPYLIGLVIFASQVVLDLIALVVLSFVFRLGIGLYERTFPGVIRPEQAFKEVVDPYPPGREDPRDLRELADRVRRQEPGEWGFWRRLEARWDDANSSLAPLYALLNPVTRHLPLPIQGFLDSGGWVPVLIGAVGLAAVWPRIHRGRKAFARRQTPRRRAVHRILLGLLGDALTEPGARQVTVNGQPARLRLVVMAPGPGMDRATKDCVDAVLESIMAGLPEVARSDHPRIEVWNGQHARDGFGQVLQKRVEFPEPAGAPSPWAVAYGDTAPGQGVMHVALAFFVSQPAPARVIKIPPGGWNTVVALRDVSAGKRPAMN